MMCWILRRFFSICNNCVLNNCDNTWLCIGYNSIKTLFLHMPYTNIWNKNRLHCRLHLTLQRLTWWPHLKNDVFLGDWALPSGKPQYYNSPTKLCGGHCHSLILFIVSLGYPTEGILLKLVDKNKTGNQRNLKWGESNVLTFQPFRQGKRRTPTLWTAFLLHYVKHSYFR